MLPEIIRRFRGLNFILYGGDEEMLTLIRENGGNPIAWFTNKADIESVPPRQWYGSLYNTIYDAIYLVVTTGNMGRRKVEQSIYSILNAGTNPQGIVILHGYDAFDPTGLRVMVEKYNGGTIVAKMDDRTSTLMKTRDAMALSPGREIEPVHIPMLEVDPSLLPYIHLSTEIEARGGSIPLANEDVPVTLPMGGDGVIPEHSSLRSWKQRRMLISAIEFLNKMYSSIDDRDGITILYLNAAPGDHIERLADMYVEYDPSFHLWGDGDYPLSGSESATGEDPSIFVRPEKHGSDEKMRVSSYLDLAREGKLAIISYADIGYTMRLVEELDPIMVMVNFTVPEGESIEYLAGDIHLPVWSTNYSMDASLISSRPYSMTTYDGESYLASMRRFQAEIRPRSYGNKILDPVTGLCTCYDCSREVEITSRYLSLVGENEDAIIETIRDNTVASRPYIGRRGNNRTLWSITTPKVGPEERSHLILYRDDVPDGMEERLINLWGNDKIKASSMSLLEIPIHRYNIIMAYADRLEPDRIISLLRSKEQGKPTLLDASSMSDIIKGINDTILVDMHTDFTPTYDSEKDTGSLGSRSYSSYLQYVSMSKINLSPLQHLMLFSMK